MLALLPASIRSNATITNHRRSAVTPCMPQDVRLITQQACKPVASEPEHAIRNQMSAGLAMNQCRRMLKLLVESNSLSLS